MPAPLVVALSVAGSVGLGYALNRLTGSEPYSKRDLALDASMGLIPGVGYAGPLVSTGRKANYIRRMGLSRSMFTKRELYVLPFVDEAIQVSLTTPIVGGSLSALQNIGAKSLSNPDRIDLTRKPKIRGATQVKSKNGKCPPGYFYDRKKRMCIKKYKKMYNQKRKRK